MAQLKLKCKSAIGTHKTEIRLDGRSVFHAEGDYNEELTLPIEPAETGEPIKLTFLHSPINEHEKPMRNPLRLFGLALAGILLSWGSNDIYRFDPYRYRVDLTLTPSDGDVLLWTGWKEITPINDHAIRSTFSAKTSPDAKLRYTMEVDFCDGYFESRYCNYQRAGAAVSALLILLSAIYMISGIVIDWSTNLWLGAFFCGFWLIVGVIFQVMLRVQKHNHFDAIIPHWQESGSSE